MRIANSKCHRVVIDKKEFIGNNLFGTHRRGWYVVYSHGYHFPIYAYSYTEGKWYGNEDKYSISTSKHQSQARPIKVGVRYVSTAKLIELIENGFGK